MKNHTHIFIVHCRVLDLLGSQDLQFEHLSQDYLIARLNFKSASDYFLRFTKKLMDLPLDDPNWQNMEAAYIPHGFCPKAWFSDVDATLFDGECIDRLAFESGNEMKIQQMTERAMNGELDFDQAIRERVKLLAGISKDALDQIANSMSVMQDLDLFLEWTQSLQVPLFLLSGGFEDMLSLWAARWQAEGVIANRFEWVDAKISGKLHGKVVCGQQKAHFVQEALSRRGLSADQCLFTGDGANDIKMMGLGGVRLGMNPKKALWPYLTGMTFSGSFSFFRVLLECSYKLHFVDKGQVKEQS